jgi:hypothetical protein
VARLIDEFAEMQGNLEYDNYDNLHNLLSFVIIINEITPIVYPKIYVVMDQIMGVYRLLKLLHCVDISRSYAELLHLY